MKKNSIILLVFLLISAGLCASPETYPINWNKAKALRKGLKLIQLDIEVPRAKELSTEELQKLRENTLKKAQANKFKLESKQIKADKRPMKISVIRVDLSLSGISFTGLGRAPEHYGEPMPDAPQQHIGTVRTTARTFMEQCQNKGLDMLLTCNSGPWTPWPPPKGNIYADPAGVTISDGVLVRDNGPFSSAFFVVYKNGKISITDTLENTRDSVQKYDGILLCHTGFGIIMKKGQKTPQTNTGYDEPLMPRMTFGLDKNHRYLYIVTIDGRQPGWSEGATGEDLFDLFTALGAYDVIDFDGGGSATLCTWDPVKKASTIYNMHDFNPRYFRPCGMLMGIYLKSHKKNKK